MVLDLIRSISYEENFVAILDRNKEFGESSSLQGRSARRLALQNNDRIMESHMDMQQLRSFLSFECDIDMHWVPLSSFKFVRVLDIHTSRGRGEMKRHHLEHLRNLLHLRYLRLIGPGIHDEIPEEVGTLKFLQTLDVETRNVWKTLPSVGLLTQLLCLRLKPMVQTVPDGIGTLMSLEELQIAYVEHEEAEPSLRQFVKELGSLRELRVLRAGVPPRLSADVRLQVDMVESLRNLEKMERLSLGNMFSPPAPADTAAWEAAGFLLSRQLRQLFLNWVCFSVFPSFCINPSRLPNLSHLSLYVDGIDEQDLRILGGLPDPDLCFLDLCVMESTAQVVCSNNPNTISVAV